MNRMDRQLSPVLEFLPCRTPDEWLDAAARDLETLLLDHAALELKAAQQAQKLIWRYALSVTSALSTDLQGVLAGTLSRLAREELRHFEQVVELARQRGIGMGSVAASRYATSLHGRISAQEPDRLVDTLVVGAIIEARSCERFDGLQRRLDSSDAELAGFYRSLLRSESRHFQDYLELARLAASGPIDSTIGSLLEFERALIESNDTVLRFHSGVPAADTAHATSNAN